MEYRGGQKSFFEKIDSRIHIIRNLSTLLEDIYAHIRTFVPRHATIIKVRRVSVAHLNHAAPYDRRTAPRVSDT